MLTKKQFLKWKLENVCLFDNNNEEFTTWRCTTFGMFEN
jgi:hypothetical protein